MRIIDDDVTSQNSSWSGASTNRFKERDKESVWEKTWMRKRNEKEKKPQLIERESWKILSMMGMDSNLISN